MGNNVICRTQYTVKISNKGKSGLNSRELEVAERGPYAANFSSQHEYVLEVEYFRGSVYPGIPVVAFWRLEPVPLGHAGRRRAGAASPLQSRPSRGRRGHRLPLLPYVG